MSCGCSSSQATTVGQTALALEQADQPGRRWVVVPAAGNTLNFGQDKAAADAYADLFGGTVQSRP